MLNPKELELQAAARARYTDSSQQAVDRYDAASQAVTDHERRLLASTLGRNQGQWDAARVGERRMNERLGVKLP